MVLSSKQDTSIKSAKQNGNFIYQIIARIQYQAWDVIFDLYD